MKKIGFVGNYLWDMYNFRGNTIRTIAKEGYETVIIAPRDKESHNFLESNLDIQNILIDLNRKSKNPLKELGLLVQLFKIYKKEKFDLVFHYTIKPNIYGSLIARILNIDSISVIPGLGYAFSKKSILSIFIQKMYKFALLKTKKVLFLNEEDKKIFLELKIIPSKKAAVLPGEGIDLEKFKIIKTEEKDKKIKFLMIARILWDKGFKEYVEAAEKVKSKHKNIEFQLLGMIDEGNPNGVPEEIIRKFHDKGIINYLGTSKDVPNIISKCDCLVLPSFYREGIPRTLMEGAAMEKTLITTDNVGCREVVKDGYNGYLCKVKSSVDLADKIEKFISLPENERIKMGKNGREMMKEKFDEEIVKKIYLKIIKEKMGKK